MSLCYEECPREVREAMERVIDDTLDEHENQVFSDLDSAGVLIDLLFAYNGVLMHKGRAAAAVVRVTNLKERAAGRRDAEIIINKDWWEKANEKQRNAVLDHELWHLEVLTDIHGDYRFDDLSRPKLRLRPHDMEIGWFHGVAKRHGIYSLEVQQARAFQDKHGQTYLLGFEPKKENA